MRDRRDRGRSARRKRVRTTRPDPTRAPRHPDLVERDFTATAPNQLWVTDLTYVPTWAGIAYVCFIIDVFSRMIVGWRVASHMRTDMVLDAIEMARWSTRHPPRRAAVSLRRRAANSRRIRYGERLAEIGAVPSIGTVGDPTTTRSPRPSTGSTRPRSSAGRHKDRGRPSTTSSWPPSAGSTGTTPNASTATSATYRPAEFEAAFYAAQQTDQTLVGIQ